VADAADGDLREVVHHLIREFRGGPSLREVVSVG
jgi:carboxylate-amine ligase